MPFLTKFVALFGIVVLCIIVTEVSGYCMRPGYPCYGGNCTESKTCQCDSPNILGHDCVVPIDATYNCTNTCNNRGTCFYHNFCYCDFGYFGPNCESKNETIECHSNFMRITMHTDKERSVFLKHNKRCEFEINGRKKLQDIFAYTRDIPLEPIPGSICDGVRKTVEMDVVTYTVLIDVRERMEQIAPFDYVTEINCTYRQYGVGEITSADNSMFEYGVLDSNGQLIGDITTNTEFWIAFWPTYNKDLYEIGVSEIRMIDLDTSKLMYEVIYKGCATHSGEEMLAGPPRIQHISLQNNAQQGSTVVPFLPLHQTYNVLVDYKIKLCNGRCKDMQCSGGQPLPPHVRGIKLFIQ